MSSLSKRPSQRAILLWACLFPVTYLIHIAEESWVGGGYSEYLYRLRGVQMSTTRFWVAQSVGLVLLGLGIYIARRLGFVQVLIVILGSVVLVNALTHIGTSVTYWMYGPGLISSVAIWLPLGVASLIRFFPLVKRRKYWIAVAIGIGINLVIMIFTLRGGRLA